MTTIDHTCDGEKFVNNANLGAWRNTVHTLKEMVKLSYDIDTSTNVGELHCVEFRETTAMAEHVSWTA